MRTARLSLVAVLVGALATTVDAQNFQTIQIPPDIGQGMPLPPGAFGARASFKTGTGRIRGRVLQADGAGAVRRAQVRVMSSESGPKSALTDAQGRFEIRDLPAGRYTVTASKSGYMTVQYGQTRPFESGKPIELADKQALDNVDIGIPRGGAISGRVVDEFGDPLPDAGVNAMRLGWVSGKRRLTPVPGRSWPTDDRGYFRIYGLPPGEYYVSATLRSGGGMDISMIDGAAMVGVVDSAAGSGSTPRSGYAATYFPGTPNAAEAQKVTVTAGQESSNVDFPLVAVRLAKVSGIVMTSEGRPAAGTSVELASSASELGLGFDRNSTRTAQDGSFTIHNVAPGDYALRTDSIQITTTTTQGDNVMVFRAGSIGGSGEQESGSMPLAMAGEDLFNLTLITSKGGRATGRVIFDGEPKPSMTSLRVSSFPADPGAQNMAFGGASVKEDGTFELKSLFGTRLIGLSAPPGWFLRSVKLNGADITDTGAEFKTGETGNLEIELTRRGTSIAGGVTAGDGAVVKDYTAVIFTENADLWRLPRTRWVTGTRPDQDGRFKVTSLPAGSYYAAAVDYLPSGEWGDPEILDRLKSRAKRFTVDEGGTQTLDLKLTTRY